MDTSVVKQTIVAININAAIPFRHKEFAKSMFIDSRLTQDIIKHTIKEPPELDKSLTLMLKYKDTISLIIRKERPDLVQLAIALDQSQDMLERVAIWAMLYQEQ
jgi:heterodisulfide reductase subunit A-like polyferredoxin